MEYNTSSSIISEMYCFFFFEKHPGKVYQCLECIAAGESCSILLFSKLVETSADGEMNSGTELLNRSLYSPLWEQVQRKRKLQVAVGSVEVLLEQHATCV